MRDQHGVAIYGKVSFHPTETTRENFTAPWCFAVRVASSQVIGSAKAAEGADVLVEGAATSFPRPLASTSSRILTRKGGVPL